MTVRERIEEQEYRILSPYASKSRDSKRAREETACEFRTAFQRDRDRIIHSKSFRRLKQKTQVYIASGDHYRMRLTHSLELSQIARTIGRGLMLNEDLIEAIALGHDVGHTPFGHAGEEALNHLIGHFCHNEQSVRVLDHVERDGAGLNLTAEVKDGILNHTGNNLPYTLEGKIVRIADRIAYLCHDYDDGIRSGLLAKDALPGGVRQALGHTPSEMITSMVSDMILSSADRSDILMSPPVEQAMLKFRAFMFEQVYHSAALAEERIKATFITQNLFQHFLNNPALLPAEFLRREMLWDRQTVVVDYVAGLTDPFAIRLFEKIFVPTLGAPI